MTCGVGIDPKKILHKRSAEAFFRVEFRREQSYYLANFSQERIFKSVRLKSFKYNLIFIHSHWSNENLLCLTTSHWHDSNWIIAAILIDYFKNVNDQYGHSVGDITLIHFAETIQKALKNKNAVLGRWGGEEFVVVCYDEDAGSINETAECLRKTVEAEPFKRVDNITCSIGVTNIITNDNFNAAFDRMDKALYKAKSEGRNCVRIME